jgi:hypothetical protein
MRYAQDGKEAPDVMEVFNEVLHAYMFSKEEQ